jgi:hypothetical protein
VDTTTTPGSVTFRLNEDADNVKVLFDSATSTNDLGALTRAGSPYTFSLGAATNYQIVVTKKSANGWTFGPGVGGAATALKISTDATRILNVFYPRGMDVNKNPKSPYFGRIYIANDQAGTTSTFVSRPTTSGIYCIGPDQSDVLSQGDNALSGGYPMTAALDSTPYRVKVGEDDNVYITDWSDNTGNLYQANPNLSSGVYALQAEDHVSCAVGGGGLGDNDFPVGTCNNHGSIASCYVAGSMSAGNLSFYTIDEDMQDDHTSTTPTQMNSLWQYSVGSTPLPYAPNPTRLWTSSGAAKDGINFVSVTMGFDRAPDGKFFITTLRSNGSESGLIVRSSDGATTLFNSYNTSRALNSPATVVDYLVSVSAVAVSRDDKWAAVATSSSTASGNTVWILPLTNGIPDLSKRNKLTTGANVHNNEVAFDAAGNLYLVNNGAEALRIFSPGGTSIAVYSNDSSGLNASFSVQRIDPDIKTQPVSITKNAGTTAAFTVTVTGSGTLKYQWTKNGANVSGATASSFTVSADVQQANAGTYTVVVTNSVFGGSITSAVVTLTVVDTAPIILTDLPATKTIIAGQTNTFTITTSGTDPRGYQWYFNDVPVAGATTTSYTRANVQNPNDAGTYYVVITNPVAPYATTSTMSALTITESIPVVTVNPISQTNGAGANVTFSVASYGTDPRTYQWQLNSVDITGATGISLTLTNVQVEDSGNSYLVNITNPQGGPVPSNPAILTVTNRLPVILTQPALATVAPSGNTSFTVFAQGENPLSYQWSKNGTPLSDGGIYSGTTTATLSLTGAQLGDAGFYSVVVTSSGGSTTSTSAQLLITQTPFVTGTGTGLLGEYRTTQVQTFTNAPTLTRIDTKVDTNYATGSPAPGVISVDNFTARWSGQVQPLYSQDYTFYDASDDGTRLWVNGQLIVDRWIPQGVTETASSTILPLVAGQKYDLVMEYFERSSSAEVHLRWSSASQVKEAIPMTQLYPAAAPVQPKLNASVVGTDLVLQWMGSYTLQSSPDLTTTFSDVVTVTNIAPFNNGPLLQPQQYLRLKAY